MPFSDYLFATGGRSGIWVQLISNTTTTAYVSTAATDGNGMYTFNPTPPVDPLGYTVKLGPSNTGPWTSSGDALFYPPTIATGLTNPMTTLDDIIISAAAGVPARLAKGSNGSVLTVDPTSGHVVWDRPLVGRRQTIAYSATITPDIALGNIISVGTLTGDITVNNPTNVVADQIVVFIFTEDGTGGWAVTFGANFKNASSPTTTASAVTQMAFLADGSGNLNAISSGGSGGGGVATVSAGTNVTIGGTASNPIINAAESGILIPSTADASELGTAGPTMIAETLTRDKFSSTVLTPNITAQIEFFAILIPASTVITKLGFLSGGTALTPGTGSPHQWFVLYDYHGNALAATADDTNTAWAQNAFKSLSIGFTYSAGWNVAASYTTPATPKNGNFYYLGVNVTLGAGGAMLSFSGAATNATAVNFKPAYAFRDTHGTQTTPNSAPALAVFSTGGGGIAYGGIL